MGGLGGPTGQALGVMKCSTKTPTHDGKVSVAFISDSGSAVFTLSEEAAEYFVVDEQYHFSATRP
jgi:hypothetical protein